MMECRVRMFVDARGRMELVGSMQVVCYAFDIIILHT